MLSNNSFSVTLDMLFTNMLHLQVVELDDNLFQSWEVVELDHNPFQSWKNSLTLQHPSLLKNLSVNSVNIVGRVPYFFYSEVVEIDDKPFCLGRFLQLSKILLA
ncbi:Receptor protein kinase TMK1 [Spatholobus suberectus]|nr:Receptor protein kinase TMK1 [Spatholobus suberectus]